MHTCILSNDDSICMLRESANITTIQYDLSTSILQSSNHNAENNSASLPSSSETSSELPVPIEAATTTNENLLIGETIDFTQAVFRGGDIDIINEIQNSVNNIGIRRNTNSSLVFDSNTIVNDVFENQRS